MSSPSEKEVPSESRVRRRTFLKVGAAGGAAVVAGGAGLALWPGAKVPLPAAGLKVLSPSEFATVSAIVERICPAMGEGAPGATALNMAEAIDAELAGMDESLVGEIKALLQVFESGLVGALFGERVRPFTRLSPAAQDEVLTAWRDSSVGVRRTGFRLLKSLTAALYYGRSETWARIGYPGPPPAVALRAGYAMNLVDMDALRATNVAKEAVGEVE